MLELFWLIAALGGVLFFLFVMLAIVVLVVAGVARMMVDKMSNPKMERVDPESSDAHELAKATAKSHEWAEANGFEFLGYFAERQTGGLIGAWKREDRPTFFCQYAVQGTGAFDLVTEFADDVCLTTGTSKSGHLFPRPPGIYCQTFSRHSLDDLWWRHIDSENYLMDSWGAELVSMEMPFVETFAGSMRRQMDYIQTMPYWPFRVSYWFFVRRRRFHGLSVQEQYERGMISMPKERRKK